MVGITNMIGCEPRATVRGDQRALDSRLRSKYELPTLQLMHVYEVRPRKDKRGADLISDALPFGRLWYGDANAVANAIGYAQAYSRSHDAVIGVYDAAGNVIETHEHNGDFSNIAFTAS